MRFPKVNQGLQVLGALASGVGLGYSAVAHQQSKALKKQEDQYREEQNQRMDSMQETMQELRSDVKSLKEDQQIIKKAVENSKNFVSDCNFNLSSLKDFFNQSVNFFSSFDLLTQVLVFNIICSSLIFSLLFSFLIGKFGNYIINKYNIVEKYPKLYNFVVLRMKLQKAYFTYLSLTAVITLTFNLAINIFTLLNVIL